MVQNSNKNYIEQAKDGWILNYQNELEIDYFSGSAYPDSIANIPTDDEDDEIDDSAIVSSDDEDEDDYDDSDEEWLPKK